ncbi:hypothetical protein FB45DRAFT_1034799 [Roridomyces roridus]|uniref:Uncharacterized protein n=1 Tax=Roridomyces roridus TaxID=1738132 RepID=A0AAD7FFZ8_9AGAR|nr:hypothetical protein FB45DRAFT_1034799 [Roridomyces roridus]
MLHAISNIHLSYPGNRDEWQNLTPHPGDELILCGDTKPGNHESSLIARRHGVYTPEDPFVRWEEVIVAPTFTLYDYSFRPSHPTSTATAIACDPHTSREVWCSSLVASTSDHVETRVYDYRLARFA